MQTHCLPDRKSRGKLQKKEVQILGTGSVFTYGIIKMTVDTIVKIRYNNSIR
jgi:hypothetical protein